MNEYTDRDITAIHPDANLTIVLCAGSGLELYLGSDGLPHKVFVVAGRRPPHPGWLQHLLERLGYVVGRVGPWAPVWGRPELQTAAVYPPPMKRGPYPALTDENDEPARYLIDRDRDPEPEPPDPWDDTDYGPDVYDARRAGGLGRGP